MVAFFNEMRKVKFVEQVPSDESEEQPLELYSAYKGFTEVLRILCMQLMITNRETHCNETEYFAQNSK